MKDILSLRAWSTWKETAAETKAKTMYVFHQLLLLSWLSEDNNERNEVIIAAQAEEIFRKKNNKFNSPSFTLREIEGGFGGLKDNAISQRLWIKYGKEELFSFSNVHVDSFGNQFPWHIDREVKAEWLGVGVGYKRI